jgi:ADP-ribosylation factor-like protein 2
LTREQRLAGASLLILANKQDIDGALSSNEIELLLSLDLIVSHQWRIMQVSAINGAGLRDGINWLTGDVATERRFIQ